jgi:hypothetical protein
VISDENAESIYFEYYTGGDDGGDDGDGDITDGCDLPGGMLYLSDANGSSVLYNSPAHCAFCIDPTYTNNSTNFLDQMGFCEEYSGDGMWVFDYEMSEEDCADRPSINGAGGWWFDGNLAGFQFVVDGDSTTSYTLTGASGGDSQIWAMVNFNAQTNVVLGADLFGASPIPAGCGTIIDITYDGEVIGLSEIVMSATDAGAIYFEYYTETVLGCIDSGACNYNADATEDDGSCLENDCAGECGGSAVVDECGVCSGSGIPDGDCDCDGNVDLGCGCGADGPSGCDNQCGSTVDNDECGVCGGDGVIQTCGCGSPDEFGIPEGACDCAGNVLDECGICGGSGDDDGDGLCPNGTPVQFIFYQSTQQAFYLFTTVTIDGGNVESLDWVGAFNGEVCVGARKWDTSLCGNGICDVPAMGSSGFGNDGTEEYMNQGDVPTFKIYDASENAYLNAVTSAPTHTSPLKAPTQSNDSTLPPSIVTVVNK